MYLVLNKESEHFALACLSTNSFIPIIRQGLSKSLIMFHKQQFLAINCSSILIISNDLCYLSEMSRYTAEKKIISFVVSFFPSQL